MRQWRHSIFHFCKLKVDYTSPFSTTYQQSENGIWKVTFDFSFQMDPRVAAGW
jgi:hypothetical protein